MKNYTITLHSAVHVAPPKDDTLSGLVTGLITPHRGEVHQFSSISESGIGIHVVGTLLAHVVHTLRANRYRSDLNTACQRFSPELGSLFETFYRVDVGGTFVDVDRFNAPGDLDVLQLEAITLEPGYARKGSEQAIAVTLCETLGAGCGLCVLRAPRSELDDWRAIGFHVEGAPVDDGSVWLWLALDRPGPRLIERDNADRVLAQLEAR